MALNSTDIATAKPRIKIYRLFDGQGLFLEVSPTGSKRWRAKYYLHGRERRMSLGIYPAISLSQARERHRGLQEQVAHGTDPLLAKREAQSMAMFDSGQTVERVAREWYAKFSTRWAASHGPRVLRRLEMFVFPWIGKIPIRHARALELLACLRRVESRGTQETARRTLQAFGRVLRYAVATGRAERDFTRDLLGALLPPIHRRRATMLDPKLIGRLLVGIEGYDGSLVTRAALRLAPLVFVRPGELRQAQWSEFDLDKPEWRIPFHRMKMRVLHVVPLSRQARFILQDIQTLTGRGRYVFPSERTYDRSMSDNTLNAALRRLGYKGTITAHGFRSMASTLLNEQGWNRDAIERQLAHMPHDPVRATYNYAEYLPERRRMMQAWADYLDSVVAAARSSLQKTLQAVPCNGLDTRR